MKTIGVFGDVHGRLVPLKAVLAWLDLQDVDMLVCTGDVATFGPRPNECVALLAERGVLTVAGNGDREILLEPGFGDRTFPEDSAARAREIREVQSWCAAQLTGESRRWLGSLPDRLVVGEDVLAIHAAPGDMSAIVLEGQEVSVPEGMTAVVAGHLHRPFMYRKHGWLWLNAGGAGSPCDGDPQACAALLRKSDKGWDATIHRIEFDLGAAVRDIASSGIPHAARMAETQARATWWF
jgi:predicted phosphodiesterase